MLEPACLGLNIHQASEFLCRSVPASWPYRFSAAPRLASPSCQATMSFPWVGPSSCS